VELQGKRALCLCAPDYNEYELIYPYYRLIEAGAEVRVAGPQAAVYHGKHGMPWRAEMAAKDTKADDWDAVVIPGGYAPDHMRRHPEMVELVGMFAQQGKVVAAICHAGWMLASSGAARGRRLTSFFAIKDDLINAGADWVDQEVVVDGKLVTSRKPDDLPAFLREIIRALA
jgi:protease I